jgi:hypothetical protein
LRNTPSRSGLEHEVRGLRWQRFLSRIGGGEPTEHDIAAAAAWDDQERLPAWAMLRRLLLGTALPAAWRLVRSVALSLEIIDDDMLIRWVDAGVLRDIRVLSIMSPSLTISAVAHACAHLPQLRTIELWRVDISRDRLRALTGTSNVQHCVLSGYSGEVTREILDSDLTRDLRSLRVASPRAPAAPWWNSPRIAQLSGLGLAHYPIDATQVADLLRCLPAGLRGFAMSANPDPTALRPVVAHSFESLESLDLSHDQLSDRLLQGAGIMRSRSLRHLDLSYNRIADRALGGLGAPGHAGLESVNLSGTRVTEAGVAALSGHKRLSNVDVSSTACSSEGLSRWLASIGDELQVLKAAGTQIDSVAIRRFGGELRLPNLELLDLSSSEVDGDGFVHLVTAAELPKLQTLVLTGCRLEVCLVLNPPRVHALRELWVDDTRIHVPEAAVLFDPTHLPHLESLRAGSNLLRAASANDLAAFVARGSLTDLQLEDSTYWGEHEFATVLTACAPTLRRGYFGQNLSGLTAVARAFRELRFPRLMELDVTSRSMSRQEIGWLAGNTSLVELASLKLEYQEPEDLEPLSESPLLGTLQTLIVDGFDGGRAEQLLRSSPYHAPFVEISAYRGRGETADT